MNKEDVEYITPHLKCTLNGHSLNDYYGSFLLEVAGLLNEPRFMERIICISLRFPIFDIMLPEEYKFEDDEIAIHIADCDVFRKPYGSFNGSKFYDLIVNSLKSLIDSNLGDALK